MTIISDFDKYTRDERLEMKQMIIDMISMCNAIKDEQEET